MPVVDFTAKLPAGECRMRFDLDRERPNDQTALSYIAGGSLYEPDVAAVFTRAIQAGDIVLDVGANAGLFTVLAAILTGPNGHVVGFEPAPANLEQLAVNLALNDIANVTVVPRPASDRSEAVAFHLNSDSDGGHSLWQPGNFPANTKSRANARSIAMTATTIDAEMARLGLAPPRLIKIDTEGAEHRVLAGAISLLRECQTPYVVAEMHSFGLLQMGSSQTLLRDFMAGLGYDTFLLYLDGTLPRLVPRDTTVICPYFYNVLFSTPAHVAALWPLAVHDPRTTAPVGAAVRAPVAEAIDTG